MSGDPVYPRRLVLPSVLPQQYGRQNPRPPALLLVTPGNGQPSQKGRQAGARGPKPVIAVDDIVDLPPDWHMQAPDVSGIDGRLLERVSKFLTFAARHDPKTPTTAERFIMLNDLCRKAPVIRALINLEKSGVPANADVIAAIALYLSEASKLRFEIRISPSRGLCLRAIAGHSSVLDRAVNCPLSLLCTALAGTMWRAF